MIYLLLLSLMNEQSVSSYNPSSMRELVNLNSGGLQSIDVSTTGRCSPVLSNVSSAKTLSVVINCNGIPPEALGELQRQLDSKNLELKEKVAEANSWASRFEDLQRKISANSAGSLLSDSANKLLNSGDLKGAALLIPALQQELEQQRLAFINERRETRAQVRLLMGQVKNGGMNANGVYQPGSRWAKSRITICFLEGPLEVRQRVAKVAKEWSLYGNLDLDFGPLSEPRRCGSDLPGDVRIRLGGEGFYSYIGNQALKVAPNEPTMVLGVPASQISEVSNGKFDTEILHEFGHVLGFSHSFARPDKQCLAGVDIHQLYQVMSGPPNNWSRENIDLNFGINNHASQNAISLGPADPNSIMSFVLPEGLGKGVTKCFPSRPITGLSVGDKIATYLLYP